MATDRERKILAIVSEALDRSPDSRSDFLKARVRDDDSALAEAKSLLAFQTRRGILDVTLKTVSFGVGDVLADRFRIVRFIGQGGMGSVYEVDDLQYHNGRRIALKTIRPEISREQRVMDQFKREIKFGQSITHPNVCRIYDLGVHKSKGRLWDGEADATLFLTMELLGGSTLSQILSNHQPMHSEEVLPLVQQMADALSCAHELGIIHRDFKPGNIMLVPSKGAHVRAVVTDFGLAIEIADDDGEDATGWAFGGTPDYMSPEQVAGNPLTASSDIYALGIVTYQMITGKMPFQGKSDLMRMVKRLHESPAPPTTYVPDLGEQWSSAILRCLERSPEQRFATAADFVKSLEARSRVAAGVSSQVSSAHTQTAITLPMHGPLEVSGPKRQRRRRNKILVGMGGAAVIGALLLAFWLWTGPAYFTALLHPLPKAKRIAILSFDNIGVDERNQAFSDGLMQMLASQLTQLQQFQDSLSVVPTSEVRKAKVASAADAKREFGANLVITGSVQRSIGGIHLIVNLIDARELRQLRSEDIFVPEADSVEMEEGVVTKVSGLLELGLEQNTIRKVDQGSTKVPGALDYYLQGTGYLVGSGDQLDAAIKEFKSAIELDPTYALAYSSLGDAYWSKYLATRDKQWVDQAWKQCRKAVDLNANLAPPHVTLSMLNAGTGHYDDAISQAKLAIGLDPQNYQAYSELADALDAKGRTKEAEETLKRAIALKPDYWRSYVTLGTFYFNHARYREAERPFRQATQLVPDSPAGYTNLGITYHMEGRETDAEHLLVRSLTLRHTFRAASNLATVYFYEGKYGEAIPIMEALVKSDSQNATLWGNLADDYRWTPGNEAKAHHAYSQAVALSNQALTVNPDDIQTISALALYLCKIGDINEALKMARRALRESERDSEVLSDSAVIYEIAGQRDRALELIGKALDAGYSKSEIAADPELSALRKDSRYTALLAK